MLEHLKWELNLLKVKTGMHESQVLALLGSPDETYTPENPGDRYKVQPLREGEQLWWYRNRRVNQRLVLKFYHNLNTSLRWEAHLLERKPEPPEGETPV